RLPAQFPGADLGCGVFHPRSRGRAGVGAGDVGGTRPDQRRQPIYRAQSGQAPERPETGPVEGNRADQAEAAGSADPAEASMTETSPRCQSGSGINSLSSPGTVSKRASFQSALACSMRSLRDETKFHQMWRGPSMLAPPSSTTRASFTAVSEMGSPGRNTSRRPAANLSPAISTSP